MESDYGSASIQGLEVHYLAAGPKLGPPVVLLHGWASSSRMWRNTLGILGERYRCFAIDLPGHGRSASPSQEWYSIAQFAGLVSEFCDQFELATPTFVGHSMGGTIALKLAAQSSSRAGRLVLINPVIAGTDWGRNLRSWRDFQLPLLSLTRALWPLTTRLLSRPPKLLAERWPAYVRRNREDLARTSADAAFGSIRAFLEEDLRSQLAGIEIPTLVLVGVADTTVPASHGQTAARLMPRSNLIRLPAGHNLPDEVPDEYYGALNSFLPQMEAA